jgi:RNA polymerase sigma-70 factor (ECF subfamily)
VAQETLARVADAAVLDRPDAEVDAWLTRVCLNRATNALRGRRRASDREDRAGRRETHTDLDPAGEVVAEEDRDAVRAALSALPERQRAVLVLRHSGYAYSEIADAIGVAPGSVGTLLVRAERAFRQSFAPEAQQEGIR